MITKRQASHLIKLIETYAADREEYYWEQDQGYSESTRQQCEKDVRESKAKLDAYLSRLTLQ